MKCLLVITGPTASGKSSLALELARKLGCSIISADSRQMFHELPIGTAAPSQTDLEAVPHHFVGNLDLGDYYSAALFEEQVMQLLPDLWERNDFAILCGGSMLYVDAVTKGIDDLPTVSDEVRRKAYGILEQEGLEGALRVLSELDPEYYATIDRQNAKRVVHAIEICLEAGRPYSELRTGQQKRRPFRIIKLAIDLPREVLFDRINRRVDKMVEAGLIEEARRVYPLRHLNSLNTVGYKELFAYFDGTMDLPTAIARIGKNTRVYAKKQITWLRRDPEVHWIGPSLSDAMAVINKELGGEVTLPE